MICRLVALCLVSGSLMFPQTPPPSTPPQDQKPSVEPVKPPEAAKPLEDPSKAVAAAVDPRTFVIGAEDILFIQVWRQPDFTRQHVVRPDGKITLPLVGEIQAAGLTPDVLGKNVGEILTKYINSPDVSVSVLQVNSKKYYINGEVNRAGAFPLVVPTRVLEALSGAGGFREFANTKKIHILRKGQILKFNYNDVVKGKHMEQNVFLESGDLIVVP